MPTREQFCELLDAALEGASTEDGNKVLVRFEPGDGEGELRVRVALFAGQTSDVTDMREWSAFDPAPEASLERWRAFAGGLARVALRLDWGWLYPEDFPPWSLLSQRALESVDDFARVLGDRELLAQTLADAFAAEQAGRHELPPLDAASARHLHALSLLTWGQEGLEAHAAALAATHGSAVYLLALLESWADDLQAKGFDEWVSRDHGSLRKHLAAGVHPLLARQLGAAGAARIGALVTRGFLEVPRDLEALFTLAELDGVALEQRVLGSIDVRGGEVVACDPYFPDFPPVRVDAPPGSFRVRIALASLPEWGRRVAAARLDLRDEPAVRWQKTRHSFGVDAGLACWMSVEARDAFVRERALFQEAHPGRNYHLDVLAPELEANGTAARPSGDWCLHETVDAAGGRHRVAVFASGLGDGFYEVRVGLNERNEQVALAIDFDLL